MIEEKNQVQTGWISDSRLKQSLQTRDRDNFFVDLFNRGNKLYRLSCLQRIQVLYPFWGVGEGVNRFTLF